VADVVTSVGMLERLVAEAEGNVRLSLKERAARDGISSRQLGLEFRIRTGASFRDYSRKVRMAAAARLLVQEQTATIAAISERLGYSDRNFNRDFHGAFKMSPSSFRAAQRTSSARVAAKRQF
jgi:AraC-like DNA-binding protein